MSCITGVQRKGRLAEIIVLDQFSRNIFRDTPDALLKTQWHGISEKKRSPLEHCLSLTKPSAFLLMPYMHSESRLIHQQAELLLLSTLRCSIRFGTKTQSHH